MKSSELEACWELGPQQAHGLWGKGTSAFADCAQGYPLEPLSVCKRQNLESLQSCPGLPWAAPRPPAMPDIQLWYIVSDDIKACIMRHL